MLVPQPAVLAQPAEMQLNIRVPSPVGFARMIQVVHIQLELVVVDLDKRSVVYSRLLLLVVVVDLGNQPVVVRLCVVRCCCKPADDPEHRWRPLVEEGASFLPFYSSPTVKFWRPWPAARVMRGLWFNNLQCLSLLVIIRKIFVGGV